MAADLAVVDSGDDDVLREVVVAEDTDLVGDIGGFPVAGTAGCCDYGYILVAEGTAGCCDGCRAAGLGIRFVVDRCYFRSRPFGFPSAQCSESFVRQVLLSHLWRG